MPKRTNEFQQLIAEIQSHLGPGSTVTEPAMLKDILTGASREVDIVVAGQVAAQSVTVSLECRDRSRPADVNWVDEAHAKHSRLPTNVLVLVSHTRFTREAIEVANKYGIRLMVLKDVGADSPERLFPNVKSLFGKGFSVAIDRAEISVPASGDLPAEWFKASPDQELFSEAGSAVGTAEDLANALMRLPQVIEKMKKDAQPAHLFLELVWEPPPTWPERLFVQKISPLVLRPIERCRVIAKCAVTVDEFPLRHAEFGELRVAWGTGTILGKPAMLVATAAKLGAQTVTLKVDDDAPKQDSKAASPDASAPTAGA